MIKLNTLKPNPSNPRNISPEKIDKLVKSIKGFEKMMALRPIIIDKDNIIIGGNQRYTALKKAGYKEIPDEWVKQDSTLTDEERREFIVKDNLSLGDFDIDLLSAEYELDELADWGLELPEYMTDETEATKTNKYTMKVESPIYEIKGECPEIKDLCDKSKTDELIKQIESSSIDTDTKQFLKDAATRFNVFSYDKIAEFYAQANTEIKAIMENLALVIIDFNKAIELGFVKISEEIADQYRQTYDND